MDQNDQSVLIEMEERIKKISSGIASLRSVIGEGKAERQLLDEIFRNAHSLKASAQTQRLDELTNLANQIETVLHSIRSGQTRLDEAALTILDNISEGKQLEQIRAQSHVPPSNEVDIPPLPFDIWQSLNEEEKYKVQTLIAECSNLFLISTSFDVADFDRRFQQLKDELGNNGEVISIAPTVETDQSGKVDFRILYGSEASLEAVEADVAEFNRVSVTAIRTLSPKIRRALERIVRAGQIVARSSGKEIDFQVHGFDLLLDQSLLDGITDSLVHLVRNAVDHGIEPADERLQHGKSARGTVMIKALELEDQMTIAVIDDGRGIDPKIIRMIFNPGFSTANGVSETSGRGVGLDVVENDIKQRGGEIRVLSKPGEGSSFEIRLPVGIDRAL